MKEERRVLVVVYLATTVWNARVAATDDRMYNVQFDGTSVLQFSLARSLALCVRVCVCTYLSWSIERARVSWSGDFIDDDAEEEEQITIVAAAVGKTRVCGRRES